MHQVAVCGSFRYSLKVEEAICAQCVCVCLRARVCACVFNVSICCQILIATKACTRQDCDVNGGCYVNDNGEELCFCNTGYTLGSDGVSCTFQSEFIFLLTDWLIQ